MTIGFRKPVIEDKPTVTGYIKQKKSRSCEDTFGNLLLWARFYNIQIAEVEGMLVSAMTAPSLSFHYPYGAGDVKKCIEALMEYADQQGQKFRMHCVTPEEFEELEALFPGKFQIEYHRDIADYVYEAEKLRTLSGKKYHGKKNHVNKFKKTYENWEYVPMSSEHAEEAFQLLLKWKNLNLCMENHDKNAESCVACNYLRLFDELEVCGGLLRVDGEAVAFCIGEKVCDDTMVVHIEKALTDYEGAYAMINQQFVEHACQDVVYVNREEDTGDEGLRKAKLSYRPVFMVEKGTVTRKKQMSNWREHVRKVVPYVPGEQPNKQGMIKLNTNENPYPPAPGVQKVLDEFQADSLRLYPDPAVTELTTCLADYYGVGKDQVFVGVGSDDVLAMAFMTFFNSDKPILFPDISYSFYSVWADEFRIPYKRPELDENFKLVKEDYYQENGGVIFPNPNAPTAIFEPLSTIEDILDHNRDVVVIVDEAYVDFGGQSAMTLIDKYDNLLVVQTFSKSRSMAGMRIGFAVGNPELIKYLNDVKYSFNSYTMNRTSICCGVEAVKDDAYFKETTAKIVKTREWAKKELRKLGFSFPDSMANFIFATHESVPAKEIFDALREENIYVRYFNSPRIDNYLRITIGTEGEMEKLIEFLRTYLKK